jgi:hypothetical protein
MAERILKLRIQQKYDTVAHWRNSTLPLLLGELALDETNGIKIGNGTDVWNNLPYITDALASELSSLYISLDNKIDSEISGVKGELESAVVGLNEEINTVHLILDSDIQSAVVALNEKIDGLITGVNSDITNIQNEVNQINTEIQQVIDEEIPTSSLVNPADPEKVVIIDCGTASGDSKE